MPNGSAEEVRLAMAWNGGVSLAVWMGGAAVELDAARRAHLGPQQEEGNERSLYHALTQAFHRELVIDILAGASAGGINGALLGAVITKRRELRPKFLRDRWLTLGDLSTLLRPVNEAQPTSLMRGDYFLDELRSTLRAVTGEGDNTDGWLDHTEPSHDDLVAGDVALDIQATNVVGTQRGLSDQWGQTLYAREYRAPLRFRQPDDFSSDALTAAARASASFPAAFEPAALMNKSARLGGFPGVKRWAIDGGLLENAPIRPAIELIPTRAAERPVKRFVCYVNAAPSMFEVDEDDPKQPLLRNVLAGVINLPREGRFIDQLVAIEDATQRTVGVKEVTTRLLDLPQPHLRATAEALLDGYCTTRTTLSLRELLSAASPDAGHVAAFGAAVEDKLGTQRLPWIPASLDAPRQAAEWRWGLRAAQRVLLLQLDLLNQWCADEDPVEEANRAEDLLAFRRPINSALARLEDARQRFASSSAIRKAALELGQAAEGDPAQFAQRLDELDSLMVGYRCEAYDAVRRGTETLEKALKVDFVPSAGTGAASVFDHDDADQRPVLERFLERALCIEVIRRAFGPDRDLEPAQPLHFVQLTPMAPVRVFSTMPLRKTGPNSGREKLTGLTLAHFSAFYRRSWRANDFMWGRLDAATRIVDLLVSATRARQLTPVVDGQQNALLAALALELVPDGDTPVAVERRQLVEEALADAKLEWRGRQRDPTLTPDERKLMRAKPATELHDDVAAVAAASEGPLDATDLRDVLRQALEADLADPKSFFTRVVCARAAQHEILSQELQPLAEATAKDGKLGCFTKPIRVLDGTLAWARAIGADPGKTLPEKLGSRDPDEATSTLAVRTLSHAVLVLISSLKTAGVPMGGTFGLLRAPFLSLSGITAATKRYRLVALLSFVAGSFYVTARAVTARDAPVNLGALWNPSTLATLTAGFGVLGLVALPFWRALRARQKRRKVSQGFWGLGMLLASGVAASVAAIVAVGFGNALTSTNGMTLPKTLALAVVAVPIGAFAVIRHVRLPVLGGKWVEKLTSRAAFTALATVAVAGWLIVESQPTLRAIVPIRGIPDGLGDWRNFVSLLDSPSQLWQASKDHWQEVAVLFAYASVPLAAVYGLHGFVRSAVDISFVRTGRWLAKQVG